MPTKIATAKKRTTERAAISGRSEPSRAHRRTPTKKGPRVAGWTELRDEGGALIAEAAAKGGEIWVGTRKVPQIRLRPAAEHEDEVDEGNPARELLVSEARERMHDVRALVAMGLPVILKSGKHRVLADRHPDAEYELVDAAVKRIRTRAKGMVGKLQIGMSDDLSALRKGLASMRSELAVANRWGQEVTSLMRELPEKLIPEPLRKQFDLLLRQRAYDGVIARVTRPDERELERS